MKNLWEKDRETLFRELSRDYMDEGYSRREARRLAKVEVDEIMTDDLDFVEDIVKKSYNDR
jgi:hypothetical protein